MADQFSKTVASLLTNATPKLGSPITPPATLQHPITSAPPSPHPTMPYFQPISPPSLDANQNQTANLEHRVNTTSKILIFNTATNAFSYRTLATGTYLTGVLNSPQQQISTMPIGMWDRKVDLRKAGVVEGEGRVSDVSKNLPGRVVAMRVLGCYKELFVLREIRETGGEMWGEDFKGVERGFGRREGHG